MNSSTSIERSGSWLALFASASTLLCCALPIILVTLGLGAVVAQTTFQFPILVTLSEQAVWMFGGSALLLIISAWLVIFRSYQCPVDPVLRLKCERTRIWNLRIWWLSLMLWIIGFTARFVLPLIV